MPADGAKAKEAAFLLEMVRLQLPTLERLSVSERNSWAGHSLPWQVLGRAMHLRTLCVHFGSGMWFLSQTSHSSTIVSCLCDIGRSSWTICCCHNMLTTACQAMQNWLVWLVQLVQHLFSNLQIPVQHGNADGVHVQLQV